MNDRWLDQLLALYNDQGGWSTVIWIVTILIGAAIARRILQYVVRRVFRSAVLDRRLVMSARRARTLEGMLSSIVSFTVILTAAIWIAIKVSHQPGLLFPVLGLFSAGFGFAARPLVSDYLAGLTLLFEYSYALGEKVEIMEVMGTVEEVGLRTTQIRADTGELYTVPNGDVRVIRNFSRGAFSPASVRVIVPQKDLLPALATLQQIVDEAQARYGSLLIEPLEIISETGELGDQTQLTVLARAQFNEGAHQRRRLMADIHGALAAEGITLTAEEPK